MLYGRDPPSAAGAFVATGARDNVSNAAPELCARVRDYSEIPIGVGYTSDVDQVETLLMQCATAHPKVLKAFQKIEKPYLIALRRCERGDRNAQHE